MRKLEEQKARTGRVRALVLKGRQQGCCYSPDMLVLTADYRWVRIGDISVGEKIFSVDENLSGLNAAIGLFAVLVISWALVVIHVLPWLVRVFDHREAVPY